VSNITVEQLQQMIEAGSTFTLLDVRNREEYEFVNLGGKLIPLQELPQRFQELDASRDIIVHCHSGVRSLHAVNFLQSRGFLKVYNLAGGISAWSERIDPTVKRY
jgi:rhodanese-related sulfurtransferase